MAQLTPIEAESILESRISEYFRSHAKFVIARFNDPESTQPEDATIAQRKLVSLAFVDKFYSQAG